MYENTLKESAALVCPSCRTAGMSVFYELEQVPVHSVLLLGTREQALNYPKGTISLAFCSHCGFISNMAFDPQVHDYSGDYESTQAYSPTFNTFHHRLATGLIDRYDLHGKEIIEIGCGQGEFLELLCELGHNQGIGFDPAYDPNRGGRQVEGVKFIPDFYSEKYVDYRADMVCCKMTLEHIHQTADFMGTVRRSIGDRPDTIVFFQVPNARYVLCDVAFVDIYYEHCSYFSSGSLARLFRLHDFEVIDLWTDYDNQYLMIEARPGNDSAGKTLPQEDDLVELHEEVAHFARECPKKLANWRYLIHSKRTENQKIVLWGGGSKGVAFLTTLGIGLDEVAYVVDINPIKSGTFMATTGQEIVTPDFLKTYLPDDVILMNPIYRPEVQSTLEDMGLAPEVIPFDHF